MSEVEIKPIVIALVINIALIYILPRFFSKPTGMKSFDDFVSYLKAQQVFIVFISILFAISMYGSMYYLNHSDGGGGSETIMSESYSPSK